ncbi:MAG: tRNA dihydrouridine synthase DusB [Patescibacteria group bacterium]
MFNWNKIKQPLIGLAPMADFTDLPFGLMCKKFGAQIIFREMVSADAIVYGNKKTLEMTKINKRERPVIQQIFGCDPKLMAEAAKIIYKKSRPDGIDINMGCSARKVVNNFHGAALMKDIAVAVKIVQAVKKAVPLPISVKTRLGWSNKEEILSFAPLLEKAGADALCLHGRTKKQGYEGSADWKIIGEIKQKLKIPLLANGGIFTREDIDECLSVTGADGILIARGALGHPWIFEKRNREEISLEEKINVILEHAQLQIKKYGDYGMILFRKHLAYYLKGVPSSHQIKQQLVQVSNLKQIKDILKTYQQNQIS